MVLEAWRNLSTWQSQDVIEWNFMTEMTHVMCSPVIRWCDMTRCPMSSQAPGHCSVQYGGTWWCWYVICDTVVTRTLGSTLAVVTNSSGHKPTSIMTTIIGWDMMRMCHSIPSQDRITSPSFHIILWISPSPLSMDRIMYYSLHHPSTILWISPSTCWHLNSFCSKYFYCWFYQMMGPSDYE